ncbi:MAG: 5-formyltetrahydrofolate cyclo-ligase [Pseudomonadota bacterium]
MTIAEAKAALRKQALAQRREAHRVNLGAASEAAARFLDEGFHLGARVIAAYRPIRTEIDPTPLMIALIEAGCRLSVPVIEGEGRPLAFREWTPGAPSMAGPFGAEVPEAGAWLTPDVVIAPLLAFDAGCWRLGYGGGYYDRTLARLDARAIGLAYAAQHVEAVPREPTDRRLDAVVTDAGVFRP